MVAVPGRKGAIVSEVQLTDDYSLDKHIVELVGLVQDIAVVFHDRCYD